MYFGSYILHSLRMLQKLIQWHLQQGSLFAFNGPLCLMYVRQENNHALQFLKKGSWETLKFQLKQIVPGMYQIFASMHPASCLLRACSCSCCSVAYKLSTIRCQLLGSLLLLSLLLLSLVGVAWVPSLVPTVTLQYIYGIT